MTPDLAPRLALVPVAGAAIACLISCFALFAAFDGAAIGSTACATGMPGISSTGGLQPAVGGRAVGATEYGGPGAPTGDVGSEGVSLVTHPNSYAELGGTSFATARALGGLAYETPLRISWGGHSVVAYKRDIGLGGGPIDGRARAIDLWWLLAKHLGIPYEHGMWSGVVRVRRVSSGGSAAELGSLPTSSSAATDAGGSAPIDGAGCAVDSSGSGVQVIPGPRARLLADGLAAAPAAAPLVVKRMIAAGNQIVGRPYVYGGGHGLPLSELAPSYDCSSSVAHLLWGGGLLPPGGDMTSGQFESWGRPGPGRWVTIYASADHVFMYVAGLRWDTHNAAGAGDGSGGIGWHPLVREDAGFVVRHPDGL